ncbi:hypothetical protein AGMMS49941_12470 [Deferribacterales bacterium]|nr:hypothetical protein AGMMS49941_12470 [Deferribacterales bacterium]
MSTLARRTTKYFYKKDKGRQVDYDKAESEAKRKGSGIWK